MDVYMYTYICPRLPHTLHEHISLHHNIHVGGLAHSKLVGLYTVTFPRLPHTLEEYEPVHPYMHRGGLAHSKLVGMYICMDTYRCIHICIYMYVYI